MKFRYLMVSDYGDVYGTDDPVVAQETWDSGDYIVIDVQAGTTYEESDIADLDMRPIEELKAEPPESDDDEGEEAPA
jgi:hypothetical protein